jgi:3-dehydroquinate synthase
LSPVVDPVIEAIANAGLCRHSRVLAIGGGAMLDAVGLASSLAHRGIGLVRMPTTTLAQGDAGIGVKNGVNSPHRSGGKNLVGTFAVPLGVINDSTFLLTLDDTHWQRQCTT